MSPKATSLVYVLQLGTVSAVSKSPTGLWGSYSQPSGLHLKTPRCCRYATQIIDSSELYGWCPVHSTGHVPFTDKRKSSMKDLIPLYLKSISDPRACQIFSSLQVLWRKNSWDTSVLCSDGAFVFLSKWWYFYLAGDSKSNWFFIVCCFPGSIHFCSKDWAILL